MAGERTGSVEELRISVGIIDGEEWPVACEFGHSFGVLLLQLFCVAPTWSRRGP